MHQRERETVRNRKYRQLANTGPVQQAGGAPLFLPLNKKQKCKGRKKRKGKERVKVDIETVCSPDASSANPLKKTHTQSPLDTQKKEEIRKKGGGCRFKRTSVWCCSISFHRRARSSTTGRTAGVCKTTCTCTPVQTHREGNNHQEKQKRGGGG